MGVFEQIFGQQFGHLVGVRPAPSAVWLAAVAPVPIVWNWPSWPGAKADGGGVGLARASGATTAS